MMIRLASLKVSGFRGFAGPQFFDLDADAVVLLGANGNGKTSFFDAVLWGISGRIPRIDKGDSRLVSLYSETGTAFVELEFRSSGEDGTVFRLVRSTDGERTKLVLEVAGSKLEGIAAESRLDEMLCPAPNPTSESGGSLAALMTRSVYLQQDVLCDFVEARSRRERFMAVSELVGAGRVAEFHEALEREKKAWTTATNRKADDLTPTRDRLAVIESRLEELRGSVDTFRSSNNMANEADWWTTCETLGVDTRHARRGPGDAAVGIERAISALNAARSTRERQVRTLRSALDSVKRLRQEGFPDVGKLEAAVRTARERTREARKAVEQDAAEMAHRRSEQLAEKDRSEQLRTLASIAIQHLGKTCPVCAQTYDRGETLLRLQGIVDADGPAEPLQVVSGALPSLTRMLSNREQEQAQLEMQLREATQRHSEFQAANAILADELEGSQVSGRPGEDLVVAAEAAISAAAATIDKIRELERSGEVLALRASLSASLAAIEELEAERNQAEAQISAGEAEITARTKTGELAQQVVEALRQASLSVVEERLEQIRPLMQGIYARFEPHPSFRFVDLTSTIARGKGRLAPVVRDDVEGKESDLPTAVLSSSQTNALAISAFLALNLGVGSMPISFVLLDDPLQSLDDVNALGLADLLRRIKEQRQVIVSTHDKRLGGLLARKLRPRTAAGRTVTVDFQSWARTGPVVEAADVQRDPARLRLVKQA